MPMYDRTSNNSVVQATVGMHLMPLIRSPQASDALLEDDRDRRHITFWYVRKLLEVLCLAVAQSP